MIGGTGKRAKLNRWRPKRWQPEYEKMVALSCLGMSNVMIAERLGYTPVHVSNVLNLQEAEDLRTMILGKMREKALTDIPNTLTEIAEKSVARLRSIVENDDLFEKAPFAVVDRGIEIIKGLGHLKHGGNGSPINIDKAVFALSQEHADALTAGLKKSNEVKQRNEMKSIPSDAATSQP